MILHVDMDAFYAAVEQRDDPALRGRPVLVGGTAEGRGVVTAASYEARRYGCRSAMPTGQALRLCPHAVVLPVRMARYREVSGRVFELLDEFSPVVEPLSIDEAFLDLAGTERLFGPAEAVARRLKARIRGETQLTASVGVAPNKFLAKLASDHNKPDGLFLIRAEEVQSVLDPLPIQRLWGVGAATAARFERLGAATVGDVRRMSQARLLGEFGSSGAHFHRLARGVDDRTVTPDRQAKSVGHEQTFGHDVEHPEFLRTVLLHQVEDVAARLRRLDLRAGSVTVKLRYPDFTTLTRAGTMSTPTDVTARLWECASGLFETWLCERPGPLRLLGVAAGGLSGPDGRQLSFPDPDEERNRRLDAATDRLRERFGREAVRRRGPDPGETGYSGDR